RIEVDDGLVLYQIDPELVVEVVRAQPHPLHRCRTREEILAQVWTIDGPGRFVSNECDGALLSQMTEPARSSRAGCASAHEYNLVGRFRRRLRRHADLLGTDHEPIAAPRDFVARDGIQRRSG